MKKIQKWIKNGKRNESGFTLIEMAIVLFVISILLLLIVPNVSRHRGSASTTGDEALIKVVETQKSLYAMENNGKEAEVSELLSGGYLTKDQVDQYNNIGK